MVLRLNIAGRGILLWIAMAFSFSSLHGQNPERMMQKEVKDLWGEGYYIEAVEMAIESFEAIEELHPGDILSKVMQPEHDASKGYILSTSAMGRYEEFDYFVIYNEKLEVQAVRVTLYRSTNGGAICNKKWLKNFVGYQGEEIVYGKDVQSISGATISAESIVEDIQRTYRIMALLRDRGMI